MKFRDCSKKTVALFIFLAVLGGCADKGIELFIVKVLHIPIFLDMIFCLAFSFINPILGIINAATGYVFSLFYETDKLVLLFSFCKICGVITVWLFKKFVMDRNSNVFVMVFAEILVLSIIMSIVESVSGGIVSRIVGLLSNRENFPAFQTDSFILLFHARIQNPLVVAILSRFPINIADRLISVPLSFFAYLGIKKMMKLEVK